MTKQAVEFVGGLLGGDEERPSAAGPTMAMLRRSLHGALRRLPAQQAEVLSLAMHDGFDNQEIAEILGSSIAVVERIRAEAVTAVVEGLTPSAG